MAPQREKGCWWYEKTMGDGQAESTSVHHCFTEMWKVLEGFVDFILHIMQGLSEVWVVFFLIY